METSSSALTPATSTKREIPTLLRAFLVLALLYLFLTGVDLSVVNLEITGQIQDEIERNLVLGKYEALGVKVIDQLIIKGSQRTVFEVIRDIPELSQVYDFFSAAGIEEQVGEEILSITVFAPTNSAMEALDIAALQEFAQLVQLSDILQFHIASERLLSDSFSNGLSLTTLKGETLTIQMSEMGFSIEEANNSISTSKKSDKREVTSCANFVVMSMGHVRAFWYGEPEIVIRSNLTERT